MDAFVVFVIHHGRRLESGADGELDYVGGEVTKFDAMDVDFVNKEDLLTPIRDLGHVEHRRLFWHDPTQIHFEDGLHVLMGDIGINKICEFILNNNKLKEFYDIEKREKCCCT
ncbi:hypothetical protein PIB30_109593 [Stylosanthes scabra]|uniref:PB1-like domain-containing protein n=1 Tax=Stylosanthes scabra TaxID=79078 RepID=A0ABU6Z1I1_9FABA|nr:hypothetical protein [Stylosanthes scabra]